MSRIRVLPADNTEVAVGRRALRGVLLPLLFALVACNDNPRATSSNQPQSNASPPWFEESAQERGVNFVWHSGHDEKYYMPECLGGGAALFDMDNDGDLDLYLVQAGSVIDPSRNEPNVLMRNDGRGYFQPVAGTNAAGDRGYGMGAACGDYDNDGDIDLYVTNVGPNVLYQNDGRGNFTDVTAAAGVGHEGWGASCAFFDYDNDGDLDLYITNYLNWSPAAEINCFNDMGAPDYCAPVNYASPAMDTLYRNNGDGTFTDVTLAAGLDAWFGNGLGVVCGDFNTDGWIDVFVANDGMRNQLWLNQRNARFHDVALQAGCGLDEEGQAKAGMGVSAADIDDDADLDVIVCNLRRESDSLFLNEGSHFVDATTRAGLRAVTRAHTRFGLGWVDFDNDGNLDLYQANGSVMRHDRPVADDPYAEPNMLFRGLDDLRFEEVKPRGGTAQPLIAASRAAAFGDIDNDGDIDIIVVNRDAPAYVLRNIIAGSGASDQKSAVSGQPTANSQQATAPSAPNHWLMLRMLDDHNRDAYGATAKIKVGERIITRDCRAAYSYMASNDPRIHVGLGPATSIDSLAVRWPDGTIEAFGRVDVDRIHTIKKGSGAAAAR